MIKTIVKLPIIRQIAKTGKRISSDNAACNAAWQSFLTNYQRCRLNFHENINPIPFSSFYLYIFFYLTNSNFHFCQSCRLSLATRKSRFESDTNRAINIVFVICNVENFKSFRSVSNYKVNLIHLYFLHISRMKNKITKRSYRYRYVWLKFLL